MSNEEIPVTWWAAHARDEDAGSKLTLLMDELHTRSSVMRSNTRRLYAIYQWGFKTGSLSGEASDSSSEPALNVERNAANAAQNAVKTKAAKLSKARTLPRAYTDGAGYIAQQQARKISKAIEGVMAANRWEETWEKVLMDALVSSHGAGAFEVTTTRGKKPHPRIRHIPIDEIYLDEAETKYGLSEVPCIYRRARRDRYAVLAEYGVDDTALVGTKAERRKAILTAPPAKHDDGIKRTLGGGDQIDVYEGFRRVCTDEGDVDDDDDDSEEERDPLTRGRHVIAIANATLVDEPFDGARFPIYLSVPNKRFKSAWGLGDMSDLASGQSEYEDMTARIQDAHANMSISAVVAYNGAKLDPRRFESPAYGIYLQCDGGPGSLGNFVSTPIDQSAYSYKASIPQDMMMAKGISSLSATSQLPAGMAQASGIALQTFENFESERMMFEEHECDRAHVALAWMLYDAMEECSERMEGKYSTRYKGTGGLESLDWKEISIAREKLEFGVQATNQLARTPAAKLQQLGEEFDRGLITADEYRRARGSLDLESMDGMDTADEDIIMRNLDLVYLRDRNIAPEGFDDLQKLILMAGRYYNMRRADDDYSEQGGQRVRDFISAAKALLPPPPAPAAPPMMPPGAPMAPPAPMGAPAMPTAA